jgi:hypothetical protein
VRRGVRQRGQRAGGHGLAGREGTSCWPRPQGPQRKRCAPEGRGQEAGRGPGQGAANGREAAGALAPATPRLGMEGADPVYSRRCPGQRPRRAAHVSLASESFRLRRTRPPGAPPAPPCTAFQGRKAL